MRIISKEYVGEEDTYTLEIDHESHNYIVNNGNSLISANSHGAAYIQISYRCLWLKANYPEEWWATILTLSDHEKLAKNLNVARSEKIKFGNLHINSLSKNFSVFDGKVIPGIMSIKGVGDSICAKVADQDFKYASIDEFIEKRGSIKQLVEPLIMLGAFDSTGCKNRKALMGYYKYLTIPAERKMFKAIFGWKPEDINKVRKEMSDNYIMVYNSSKKNPVKNKKIPSQILKWVPDKPNLEITNKDKEITKEDIDLSKSIILKYEDFEVLFKEDFTLEELLNYEKTKLGYYWNSPIEVYDYDIENTIANAKVNDNPIDCVIDTVEKKRGPKKEYLKITIMDSIESAGIMMFDSEISINDPEVLKPGIGIRIPVKYNKKYRSFNVISGSTITPLEKKNEKNRP